MKPSSRSFSPLLLLALAATAAALLVDQVKGFIRQNTIIDILGNFSLVENRLYSISKIKFFSQSFDHCISQAGLEKSQGNMGFNVAKGVK